MVINNNLKKILLVLIVAGLGLYSGFATANTVVRVGTTGNEYAFTVGSTTTFYDVSIISTNYSADSVLLRSEPWWGNRTNASLFAKAVNLDAGGYVNVDGGNHFGPYFAYDSPTSPTSAVTYTRYDGFVTRTDMPRDSTAYFAFATVHVDAPEIDGALIPQVGFLIACLFIILGRRKESTEPLPAV